MYGVPQPRPYTHSRHASVPVHGPVPASYHQPHSIHKVPESRAYGAQRSALPAVVRSRPRASSSASTLRNEYDHTFAVPSGSASGSRQQHASRGYHTSTGLGTSLQHAPSPSRPRSRSQSQAQSHTLDRHRSPAHYSQMDKNYLYQYGYRLPTSHRPHPTIPGILDTGRDGPVIPTDDFMRRSLAKGMEEERRAAATAATYSQTHGRPLYGEAPSRYGRRSVTPPEGNRSQTQYSTRDAGHRMPPPPPPRPPSPASHYPFANYKSPGAEDNIREGRERRSSSVRPHSPRKSGSLDSFSPELTTHEPISAPYAAAAPSQADSTVSDPLIHPALGWWPDQRRPALQWDLSSSSRPRYTKREFDADELASSPFSPPISHMRLVLDPQARWVFDLQAPRGERYITLARLLKEISNLMRNTRVPHSFWVRARSGKKEAILRSMLKRTGRSLPVPPPHRRPKTRGQILEEAAVESAPNGYTNLLVMDLLCEDVMFAGLQFHKEPDEWVLRTTRRST